MDTQSNPMVNYAHGLTFQMPWALTSKKSTQRFPVHMDLLFDAMDAHLKKINPTVSSTHGLIMRCHRRSLQKRIIILSTEWITHALHIT